MNAFNNILQKKKHLLCSKKNKSSKNNINNIKKRDHFK